MIEVSIKVPKDIGEIVSETSQAIYIEALKEVVGKRLSQIRK